jgi:hypothetical protein
VGALPAGLVNATMNKLQAWSGYGATGYFSYLFAGYTTYVQAPTYSTGYLYGTSVGLDRPLAAILSDLRAALDPSGIVLGSWGSSLVQPCPPWLASYYSNPGQRSTQPGYGRWVPGLFKPTTVGAVSGTSYCQDYGTTPLAPFIYSTSTTITPLDNPTGSASAPSTAMAQNAALVGGVSSLLLNGLGLRGSVPVQLRELRTTTVILLSRNALAGSLPSDWGSSVSWTYTSPGTGFEACTLLDLGQNALNATLPATIGLLGNGSGTSKLGLALYDNLISGSLPPSVASLAWLALAYNPLLVGALPAGVGSGKLYAWSANQNGFFSWASVLATTTNGIAPNAGNLGYGTGVLFGTSIGLDRALASILVDLRAALDPSGVVLGSWNASLVQPCPPWSNANAAPMQSSASPGYGRWLPGLFKPAATVAAYESYCQDYYGSSTAATSLNPLPFTTTAVATWTVLANPTFSASAPATAIAANGVLAGGISALVLHGLGLSGSVPLQLRELRTASVIMLSRNALSGSLPGDWGRLVSWNNSAATTGFDACTLLDVGQNALSGALPASAGQLGNSSGGSRLGLSLYDNQFSGTMPASYASLAFIAIAYNPLLVGALPAGVNSSKLYAWSGNLNGFYAWSAANVITTSGQAPLYSTGYLFGTSIGLDRPLPSILSDLRAALDPGGAVLATWNASLVQPCPPWYPAGTTLTAGTAQRPSSPGYGAWLPGLFKPGTAATINSYCQEYYAGVAATADAVPYTNTAATTYTALTNPTFLPVTPVTTILPNAALVGGISALVLNGLGLSGTVPVQLRELRTSTFFLLSRNALSGSLPGGWGQLVSWNNSAATTGFDACTLLDVGQNALSGVLPASVGQLGNSSGGSRLGLSLYDNQFSGTLPPSYASLSWLAIAYNPLLVGALPPGVNSSKLFAWSGFSNGFYAWSIANVIAVAGQAPLSSTGYLFGTSLGLDRPLASILSDLRAALDPSGAVLSRWNAPLLQPCPPWYPSGTGATAGTAQRPSSPGYGTWLPGLFKPGTAASINSYCQDYYAGVAATADAVPFTTTAAATYTALTNPTFSSTAFATTLTPNSALVGGISALVLNALGLRGSLPVQLRELRTTTFFMLSRNSLSGSLPSDWGQPVSWNNFSPSTGFDACRLLDVGQNALNATLPAGLGVNGSNAGLGLSLYDNAFAGSVPASYASLSWLAIAYNPLLVGALPAGVDSTKLFAWSASQSGFFSWSWAYGASGRQVYGYSPSYQNVGYGTGFLYGTSIGLDRPLVNILLDLKAALDPAGAVLSSWNASQLQPCRPWSDGGSAPFQNSASPVAGKSWTYISTAITATSAEYCQDWQSTVSGFVVYTTPTTWAANTAPVGGVAALWLSNLGLNGSLPVQLQELRTASLMTLSLNALSGSIPSVWCVACVARASLRGAIELAALELARHARAALTARCR